MAWSGYPGPQGHGITITRNRGTAQCNSCYAQNWTQTDEVLRYEPNIVDIDFGPCMVRLCPDCLRKLGVAVLKWLGGNPIPDPDPDEPF